MVIPCLLPLYATVAYGRGPGRFFPSSKICSHCGHHHAELMRETHWTCPQCGTGHDRNENAALNLLGLALEAARDLPKSTLGAVGPDVTLPDAKALTNPLPSRKGRGTGRETGTDEGRTGRTILPSAGVDGSESWTQAD